jgi:septum site-determining protein MinC
MDIKGTKDGILISIENENWPQTKKEFFKQIESRLDFFQGANVLFNVGTSVLNEQDIIELKDKLTTQGIVLNGIISDSLETQNAAKALNLHSDMPKPMQKQIEKLDPLNTNLPGEPAVLVRRTMRSGFKVAYQGHVIIFGDVNPGAEIIASGSIIVWGSCRGTVHAGANGDEACVVCALDLSPMQLRIAAKITITPQDHEKPLPEVARIKDDRIIAEPWKH